jgi:hypothetical protein
MLHSVGDEPIPWFPNVPEKRAERKSGRTTWVGKTLHDEAGESGQARICTREE